MKTKFKKVVRQDANGSTVVEFNFPATLTGINTSTPQKYTNSDGVEKVYYLGTIDFVAPNGTPQTGVTTQIHAKSFDHGMKVGSELLSTLTKDNEGNLWVRTSHLIAINTLDATAFEGLSFDEIEASVEEGAGATA